MLHETKSISILGTNSQVDDGWRVSVKIGGRTRHGPRRKSKREADADLERARGGQNQQEFTDILSDLMKKAQGRRRTLKRKASMSGIGTSRPHANGYRATAKLEGCNVSGPTRTTRAAANADLKQARKTKTPSQYIGVLRRLGEEAKTERAQRRLVDASYAHDAERTKSEVKAWRECTDTVKERNEGTYAGERKRGCKAKAIPQLGSISTHGNGWRVAAAPMGQTIYGPYRCDKREAESDLKRAREAQTREQFCSILCKLKRRPQSETQEEEVSDDATVSGARVDDGRVLGTYDGIHRTGNVDADIKQSHRAETLEEHLNIPVQIITETQSVTHSEAEESHQIRKHVSGECSNAKEVVQSRNPDEREAQALFEVLDNITSAVH